MLKSDQSGSIALLFALLLPVVLVGVGGGIDVSRAIDYKQRLTSAADLTCRQAEVYVEPDRCRHADGLRCHGADLRDQKSR